MASWLRRSCISVVVVVVVVAVCVATFWADFAVIAARECCGGATSRILSASEARSSVETVSEAEAKTSCTFVGKH